MLVVLHMYVNVYQFTHPLAAYGNSISLSLDVTKNLPMSHVKPEVRYTSDHPRELFCKTTSFLWKHELGSLEMNIFLSTIEMTTLYPLAHSHLGGGILINGDHIPICS